MALNEYDANKAYLDKLLQNAILMGLPKDVESMLSAARKSLIDYTPSDINELTESIRSSSTGANNAGGVFKKHPKATTGAAGLNDNINIISPEEHVEELSKIANKNRHVLSMPMSARHDKKHKEEYRNTMRMVFKAAAKLPVAPTLRPQ